jgi:hypothetical protein
MPRGSVGEHDDLHRRIGVQLGQGLLQGSAQGLGERVHRLGAVQGDDGDGVLAFDEQHGDLRFWGISETSQAGVKLASKLLRRRKLAKPRPRPEALRIP